MPEPNASPTDADTSPRKVVPVTFEYVSFQGGKPTHVEEKRHLYYTMGSLAKMFKKFGVQQERARQMAEKEDPQEAQRELEDLLETTETGMTKEEGTIVMLWAGLLAEASARGEDLTVEQVGNMIDIENAPQIGDKIEEAFQYFQAGEEAPDDTEPEGEEEGGDTVKKPPEMTKTPR